MYYARLKYSKKEVQVNSLAEKKLKGQDWEWVCTPVGSTEVEAASAKKQKKGSTSPRPKSRSTETL